MKTTKTKIQLECDDPLWDKVKIHKINAKLPTMNAAVIDLIEEGLKHGK